MRLFALFLAVSVLASCKTSSSDSETGLRNFNEPNAKTLISCETAKSKQAVMILTSDDPNRPVFIQVHEKLPATSKVIYERRARFLRKGGQTGDPKKDELVEKSEWMIEVQGDTGGFDLLKIVGNLYFLKNQTFNRKTGEIMIEEGVRLNTQGTFNLKDILENCKFDAAEVKKVASKN